MRGRARVISIATVLLAVVFLTTGRTSAVAQQETFRASTDVVELDVTVKRGNRHVTGLRPEDFEVIDNGIRQAVTSVAEATVPIDVTIMVDASESIGDPLRMAIERGVARVRARLRDSDRLSIVAFNHQIVDVAPLAPAVAAAPVALPSRAGQTSLFDAIAVGLVSPLVPDRRQMALVFTDGMDTSSFLERDVVRRVAGRSHAALFAVASGTPRTVPMDFLQELADATGGFAQLVVPFRTAISTPARIELRANEDLIEDAFVRAFEEFRSSYVVRFELDGPAREGWHEVTVRVVKPGASYQVRTRQRYFVGRGGS